jgi:DNA invertase Pin-like site-specific DNA recombinase
VSGKLPLVRRPGLLQAIEMVEVSEADHIVVAYFDRLVRSLKVQLEVIERVKQAGGVRQRRSACWRSRSSRD